MASWLRVVRLAASSSLLLLVGCLALTDTPDEWPCSSTSDCSGDERCVPPLADIMAGCSGLTSCLGEAKVCRDPTLCSPDNTCPPGHTCHEGRCGARTCGELGYDVPGECGAYACDTRALLCWESCGYMGACGPGYACSQGICVPPECSDSDVSACQGYRCRDGLCRHSCNMDSDCTSDLVCVQGHCQP